jgi:predicted TIM-barrel fold metal-dependent hydrolase
VSRGILEPLTLLTDLVFGGVLERFPKLRVVLAEYELSWLHPFISKMDGTLQRARSEAPDSPTVALLPSELIRRQVYITFQDDRIGVLGTEVFNMADNYMWASDYPHGGSTWPNSPQIVESQFKGIPNDIKQKLIWDNCAKFYGVA